MILLIPVQVRIRAILQRLSQPGVEGGHAVLELAEPAAKPVAGAAGGQSAGAEGR